MDKHSSYNPGVYYFTPEFTTGNKNCPDSTKDLEMKTLPAVSR